MRRYASWFPTFNEDPDYRLTKEDYHLHAFPHWNWASGDKVDIWSFSNAASVELLVNGKSMGKQPMKKFSHIVWKAVPFEAGQYRSFPAAFCSTNTSSGVIADSTWID